MTIVCAPDSFKESLSAARAARIMADAARTVWPRADVREVPMADGGEGTTAALAASLGGTIRHAEVTGPLGAPVRAAYALAGATAVIECAEACGLHLVPPGRRDPERTTTRGVGELMRAAIDAGARHLIVGLGGSATNDGGAGMLAGLGGVVMGADGRPIGDGVPAHVTDVRLPRFPGVRIEVACDVDNPLTGERGASAIFGPQKGASSAQVRVLDDALARYATRFPGVDHTAPGAGAAGGLGFALLALGAQLRPGFDIVADAVGLDATLAGARLVLTGEGRIDHQTRYGKTPAGVASRARAAGAPTIAFAGAVADEETLAGLFHAVVPIVPAPMTLADAMAAAEENLRRAVERTLRLIDLS